MILPGNKLSESCLFLLLGRLSRARLVLFRCIYPLRDLSKGDPPKLCRPVTRKPLELLFMFDQEKKRWGKHFGWSEVSFDAYQNQNSSFHCCDESGDSSITWVFLLTTSQFITFGQTMEISTCSSPCWDARPRGSESFSELSIIRFWSALIQRMQEEKEQRDTNDSWGIPTKKESDMVDISRAKRIRLDPTQIWWPEITTFGTIDAKLDLIQVLMTWRKKGQTVNGKRWCFTW